MPPFRVCSCRKWQFQRSRWTCSQSQISVSPCQDLHSSAQKVLKNVNLLRPCILLEGRQIHLKKNKKAITFHFPHNLFISLKLKTVEKKSHRYLIKLTSVSFMICHFIGGFGIPDWVMWCLLCASLTFAQEKQKHVGYQGYSKAEGFMGNGIFTL